VKSVSGRAKIFLVEVPLLYEVEFPIERDLDLVVASSRQTQLSRLLEKRNVKRELAVRIIESQMSLEKKMKRADIVIWNDGSEQSATSQVDHLIERCRPIFIV
jgi:dephospho-CoA kinase